MVRYGRWSGVVSCASGFVNWRSWASDVVVRRSCASGIFEGGRKTSAAAGTSRLSAGGEVVERSDAVGVAVGVFLMEQAI